MLLFVYGTLRKGGNNHWRIQSSPYVFYTTTREPMYMVAQPSRSFPFVSRYQILPNTTPTPITGEVYDVSEQTLTELDALEANYVRTIVTLSEDTTAYMYVIENRTLLEEIRKSGRFIAYSNGDWHGSY